MRISYAFWMMIAAPLFVNCGNAQEPSNPDSSDSTSETPTELFSLDVKEDGYDITFTETERGKNYSLATVEIKEGTSVGSSMVIMKCVYEIAKQREFEYFINADLSPEDEQDENTSIMKIFFTNDKSVPLKELVGDAYSEDLQEVYDDLGLISLSMLKMMFDPSSVDSDFDVESMLDTMPDSNELVKPFPPGQETVKGLYINAFSGGDGEITVEELERGENFSTVKYGFDNKNATMDPTVFVLTCICELATSRKFEFVVMAGVTMEHENPGIMRMHFANDADISIESLVSESGHEYAEELMARLTIISVTELCETYGATPN